MISVWRHSASKCRNMISVEPTARPQ